MADEIQEDDGEKQRRKKRPRDDDDDDFDDEPRKRSVKKSSGDSGVGAVIPYRNGYALASYYFGVFGMITCLIGLGVLGIVPLILGIMGLRKAKSDPEARGTAHAWTGIILGAIQLLSGCGLIGFIAFMAATDGGKRM